MLSLTRKMDFIPRATIRLEDAEHRGDGVVRILHNSYQWRKTRKEHLKFEECCQMCSIEKKLEVHHIVPWHISEELRYVHANLVTLCRDCHYRFGHFLNWHNYNSYILELCHKAQEIRRKAENEKDNDNRLNAVAGCCVRAACTGVFGPGFEAAISIVPEQYDNNTAYNGIVTASGIDCSGFPWWRADNNLEG